MRLMPHSTTTRTARRTAAALAGVLVAATAIGSGAGAASADESEHLGDQILFTSHVRLTPPRDGQPGRFALVSDTCSHVATDSVAVPCTFVASGTVGATGEARGVVTSEFGVIRLDETYTFTSPTTLIGSGPVTEVRTGAGGARMTGTFVGQFTSAPTDDPNVLLDWGSIVVTH